MESISNWISCRSIQEKNVLVISNQPHASRTSEFEITRSIAILLSVCKLRIINRGTFNTFCNVSLITLKYVHYVLFMLAIEVF